MPLEGNVLVVETFWSLSFFPLLDQLLLNLFKQYPGTEPAKRVWSSINVGTEIYVSRAEETAEWTVSEFDVLIHEDVEDDGSSSYCNHPFCNGRN